MNNVQIAQRPEWVSEPSEYSTPNSLFEPLDKEFHFTLDVAASALNAKCEYYLDEEVDALSVNWHGICWLNPPFRGIRKWIEKVVIEQARGVTTVCLIPIVTSGWFHKLVIPNAEIRFVRGNPKFGGAKAGLMWPLLICIFRGKPCFAVCKNKSVTQ